MSDLRTDLDRLGERAAPKSDAFEHLERRRRRKERNRRIGAGALALVLVVGGSVAAFRAFGEADAPTVGGGQTQDGFFALWPEQTSEGLAAAQERADAGDRDFAWRSDPRNVAGRFALEKLLWPAVDVAPAAGSDLESDEVIFLEIRIQEGASCDQVVSDATCPTSPITLTMERLGRADGLWSITEVAGQDLALPLIPGEEVAVGTTITVPTNLPDGDAVSMGVALLSACEAPGSEVFGRAQTGRLEFTVPDVPDGCVGYVYVVRPPTREGAVAIGSFLFTDAQDIPRIGYLVEEVAAIPVRFANTPAVEVAEFTCDETGTISPARLVVAAQPDGVHTRVENVGSGVASFAIGEDQGATLEAGGVAEGSYPLEPGNVTVSCSVEGPAFGGVASSASLDVVDPNGYFVPAFLSCPSTVGTIPEYVEGTNGFAGDPVQVVRDHLSGLEFDDTVERALYPEGEGEAVVRVVRGGEVVARATLRYDGRGGWLLDTLENCDGMPFGWSEEVTGVTGPPAEPGDVFVALCTRVELDDSSNVHDGSDLHVDGSGSEFDTDCLRAPGEEPITILFSNLDPGVQRNISLYVVAPCLADAVQQQAPPACPPETLELPVFRGEVIEGVSEIVYEVGVLESGVYYFQDDVHPGANGLLLVT